MWCLFHYLFCITDVGFMVGGDTGINYLVLQIHYKDVSNFLPPSKYICFYNFFKNKYGTGLVQPDFQLKQWVGV